MPDAKQFLDNAMQDIRGWLASYERSGKISDLRMVQHWLEQALRQAETLDKH